MFKLHWVVPILAAAPFAAAHAVAPAPAALMPPAQLGLCAACHGKFGHAQIPGAPNLAGQPYQYLLQALHEYRDGQRSVQVMRTAVGALSPKEMQALAHWFAAQSPCKPAQAAHP
ncbi:MAG TPA: c-type cytochrome [Rhodanobacteraceae bacterium]